MPFTSGPFAIGDDLTRHDPGAEPRHRLTAARPRPRRDAIPVLHVPSDGVGPAEAARRYADQQARKQAEGMATDGYAQARAIDLAAEREAVATDLGDHGCDRSTALHFAAIVVAGLVARGKL